MKTIVTEIPNEENKSNYALIHVKTYEAILHYLDDLPNWLKEDGLEDWVSEMHNELSSLRRL